MSMINKSTIFTIMPVLYGCCCLMTGCFRLGGMERNEPEKHFFMLNLPEPVPITVPEGKKKSLKVRTFRVSPPYDGRDFVHRLSNEGYESDDSNEFFVSPGPMLSEAIRLWLQKCGLFRVVVAATSDLETGYVLEGEVLAIYGDFRDEKAPKAVMEMEFLLIKHPFEHPAVVFQKRYHESVQLKSGSPQVLVMGWEEALLRILYAFREDLTGIDP